MPKSGKNAAISRFLHVDILWYFLIYPLHRKYQPITQWFHCDTLLSDTDIFFSIFSHFRCVQFHPIPYKPSPSVSHCKAECTHQKSDFFSRIGDLNIQNRPNHVEYMTIGRIFSRKRKYQKISESDLRTWDVWRSGRYFLLGENIRIRGKISMNFAACARAELPKSLIFGQALLFYHAANYPLSLG